MERGAQQYFAYIFYLEYYKNACFVKISFVYVWMTTKSSNVNDRFLVVRINSTRFRLRATSLNF